MPEITIIFSSDDPDDAAMVSLGEALWSALEHRTEMRVAVVPPLMDLEPQGPTVAMLRATGGLLIVVAPLWPRAAFWLLAAYGIEGQWIDPAASATGQGSDVHSQQPARSIACIDARQYSESAPLLAEIERIAAARGDGADAPRDSVSQDTGELIRRREEGGRRRWYPVVDRQRCTDCLECLNFCLFGVYDVDEQDRLVVIEPDACRDGCPACARVCPEQAIMFPRHENPAIAGDPSAGATQMNMSMLPMSGAGSAKPPEAAVEERRRCLQEKMRQQPSSDRDELDQWVDELDQADL